MSTLAYAALTSRFQTPDEQKEGETPQGPSGTDKYIEVLAGLVPAEVLALHATILSFTTDKDQDGAILITEPGVLSAAFYGLLLLSVLLFVAPKIISGSWQRLDWLRALLAPLSFVVWTALQKATAFDAVFESVQPGYRMVGALLGAAILAMTAAALPERPKQRGGSLLMRAGEVAYRREELTILR